MSLRYIVEYDKAWGWNGTYWVCDSHIDDGEAWNIAGFATRLEAEQYAAALNEVT